MLSAAVLDDIRKRVLFGLVYDFFHVFVKFFHAFQKGGTNLYILRCGLAPSKRTFERGTCLHSYGQGFSLDKCSTCRASVFRKAFSPYTCVMYWGFFPIPTRDLVVLIRSYSWQHVHVSYGALIARPLTRSGTVTPLDIPVSHAWWVTDRSSYRAQRTYVRYVGGQCPQTCCLQERGSMRLATGTEFRVGKS